MINKTWTSIPSNTRIDKAIQELPISNESINITFFVWLFSVVAELITLKGCSLRGVLMQNTAELQTQLLKLVHEKNK